MVLNSSRPLVDQLPRTIQNYLGEGTEFSLMTVSPTGQVSIFASDLYRPYLSQWYSDDVQKEAAAVAISRRENELAEFLRLGAPPSRALYVTPTTPNSRHNSSTSSNPVHSRPGRSRLSISVAVEDEDTSETTIESATSSPNQSQAKGPRKSASGSASTKHKKKLKSERTIKPQPTQHNLKEEDDDIEHIDLDEEEWVDVTNTFGMAESEHVMDISDEDDDVVGVEHLTPLVISDSEAISRFLDCRFIQLQQLDCKTVAKCWIKVVEPKKQSHSPYNKGDLTRPSWWPRNVQHREPDHLLKQDRIVLLKTIIRANLCPISKLRAATDESPQLLKCKKRLLAEVYDVIELEQRYIDGVIDEGYVREIRASPDGYKPKKRQSRKSSTAKSGDDETQGEEADRAMADTRPDDEDTPHSKRKKKGKEPQDTEPEAHHPTGPIIKSRRSSIRPANSLRRKSTPGPVNYVRSTSRVSTPQPAAQLSGSPASHQSPMSFFADPAAVTNQMGYPSPMTHVSWDTPSSPVAIPSGPTDNGFRRNSTTSTPHFQQQHLSRGHFAFDPSLPVEFAQIACAPPVSADISMAETTQMEFPAPEDPLATYPAPYQFQMDPFLMGGVSGGFQNYNPYP